MSLDEDADRGARELVRCRRPMDRVDPGLLEIDLLEHAYASCTDRRARRGLGDDRDVRTLYRRFDEKLGVIDHPDDLAVQTLRENDAAEADRSMQALVLSIAIAAVTAAASLVFFPWRSL